MLHFVAPFVAPWISVLYKQAGRCSTVAPCKGGEPTPILDPSFHVADSSPRSRHSSIADESNPIQSNPIRSDLVQSSPGPVAKFPLQKGGSGRRVSLLQGLRP